MAKNKESKGDGKNRRSVNEINEKLADLNRAHNALVLELLRVFTPLNAAATLHGIHAAMMESEMGIITQASESRTTPTAYEVKVSKKHANGKAKENA